jgi:hypothetical protein
MLSVLATLKTREAYKLIESLIFSRLPTQGRATEFLSNLHDSLLLSRQILPSLLRYTGDSILSFPLAYLQQTMLDSNVIAVSDLAAYRKQWLSFASNRLAHVTDPERDYSAYDGDLVNVLLSFNDREANKIVVGYLSAPEIDLKKLVFLGLTKHGEPVSQYHALEIAADKYYRIAFYEELAKGGNEKLFPRKYLNQKSFAESYLYQSFDEDEPSKIIPLGERVSTFHGKKQKFYLYKVVYQYDGEELSYLGISGPFAVNHSVALSDDSIAGLSEEVFEQSKINEHFKNYLADYEDDDDE